MVLIILMFVSKNISEPNLADTILLTDMEREWISNNSELKAIVSRTWKPINFVEEGEARGFSVDYLNLITEKLGITIEYIDSQSWEEGLELIRSGEADIAHSISITDDRSTYLNFTEEYLNLPMVYFGRLGSDNINNLSDFDGKRVGLIEGNNSTLEYMEKNPQIDFAEIKNIDDALFELSTGSIDVLISTLSITNYTISQTFNNGIEVLGQDFLLEAKENDNLRLAATNRKPVLISILSKGMDAVSEKEFSDISNKWTIEGIKKYDIGLTVEEREWLSQNRIIKVEAAKADFPIQFINENGDIDGIAGAYLNEISKRLNVNFVWSGESSFGDRLMKIKSLETDIIAYITPLEERKEILEFTDPYIRHDFVIFARDDSFSFSDIESLNGRSIAQTRGTPIVLYVRQNYPDINIIEVDGALDALRLVSTGQVDAYLSNIPTTTSFISSTGISNISVTGITSFSEENSIGISINLPLLSSSIKKAINDIGFQTRNEIANYWFSVKVENRVDYRPFGYFISVVILACVILLIWNRKLMVAKLDDTSAKLEEDPYLKKVNLFDS